MHPYRSLQGSLLPAILLGCIASRSSWAVSSLPKNSLPLKTCYFHCSQSHEHCYTMYRPWGQHCRRSYRSGASRPSSKSNRIASVERCKNEYAGPHRQRKKRTSIAASTGITFGRANQRNDVVKMWRQARKEQIDPGTLYSGELALE